MKEGIKEERKVIKERRKEGRLSRKQGMREAWSGEGMIWKGHKERMGCRNGDVNEGWRWNGD
jgi:hypothetical protein